MIFHVGTKERTGEKMKKLFTSSGKFVVSPPPHKHFNLKTHPLFPNQSKAAGNNKEGRLRFVIGVRRFDFQLIGYAQKLVDLFLNLNFLLFQRKTSASIIPVKLMSPMATGMLYSSVYDFSVHDLQRFTKSV